ncbi:MAG TPA: hypothetical protein VD790_01745 [Thermoleophilaceae bacterium]|nr:hypothetical protein [Thermoleophilaceae bacterium]
MSVNDLVLVRGLKDTRHTLSTWQRDPLTVVGGWLGWSFLIALGLLASVYLIAAHTTPDYTPLIIPGLHDDPQAGDIFRLLYRNGLVLALHAMACVAGFIAGSALPYSAEQRTGASRWVHEKAGPLAIAFVIGATAFSLVTQAYVLGGGAATLSWQLDLNPAALLAIVSVHALPELVALFLPLAAWMVASRNDDWHELLAATFVTVAIAVPVLVLSAVVEVYLTPQLLAMAV